MTSLRKHEKLTKKQVWEHIKSTGIDLTRMKKNMAIVLRKKGLTFEKIGKELGVSGTTVQDWLKDEPFEKERKEKYGKDSRSIAKELRLHGFKFSEIGKELGVSWTAIQNWLKDEPFEKNRIKRKMPNFTFEEKERLIKKAIELRLKGLALEKIGKEIGVSFSTVQRLLKDEPFEKERKEKYGKDSRSIAKELRLHGFKLSEIGKELGVTKATVQYWLKDEPFEKERVKIKRRDFTFEEKERLIKKAIELRKQGWSLNKIDKELGVHEDTVWKWLKDEPFEIERRRLKEEELLEMKNTAKELRLHGFKLSEIGKELGVTRTTVQYWLKDEPFEKNRVKIKMPNFTFEERKRLIKKAIVLRKKGLTLEEIGKRFGVSYGTVFYWLKDEPFEKNRVKRKRPNFTFEEKERLIKKAIELRLKGLTFKKIGKELGVHKDTVWQWLKDHPTKNDQ